MSQRTGLTQNVGNTILIHTNAILNPVKYTVVLHTGMAIVTCVGFHEWFFVNVSVRKRNIRKVSDGQSCYNFRLSAISLRTW